MSTNAREELARIVESVAVDDMDWDDFYRDIADAILAAGWRKVDPAADTRTEWAIHDHLDGVTSPVGQLNAEERTRMFAKHRPHISVRSRDVITTPWREVES